MESLCPKQKEFILNSVARINIAHGAIRSGKTYCTLIRFAEEVIKCQDDDIYMIGASFSTIVANGVQPILNDLYKGYSTWFPSKQILMLGERKIHVIGASDESSVRRIQGNTHSLQYVDEMTILPQNFLEMLYSRLSKAKSRLFGSTNPDSPAHPLKEKIDQADGKLIYALHFNLEDNLYLENSYREMVHKMYKGLWYKRYVLGQWVMAEGAVYESFSRKHHVCSRIPGRAKYWFAGVDVGTANPFAVVIIGFNDELHGLTQMVWVEKEYFWDSKQNLRQKTYEELADDLQNLIEPYGIKQIYIDPSALAFKVTLSRRGLHFIDANNDVRNGIATVDNFLGDHLLTIHNSCVNTIREMENYMWDSKKSKLGIEEPIKKDDHCMDALRYALHTKFGNKKRLKGPLVKEYKDIGPSSPMGKIMPFKGMR